MPTFSGSPPPSPKFPPESPESRCAKKQGRWCGESADDAKLAPGLERMDKQYSKDLAYGP